MDNWKRDEFNILVLSPTAKDREVALRILEQAGFAGKGYRDADALLDTMRDHGAGMLLVASESLLDSEAMGKISAMLRRQQAWSDLPVCILMHSKIYHRRELRAVRELENLHSITFMERPIKVASLISMTRSSLQARRRQYQIRQLLDDAETAVRQRDEFLAMLSHELRNPMSAITNAVNVLTLAPERSDKALHILGNQVEQVNRMVDDLLDVARITRGKVELQKQPLDIAAVVREAAEGNSGILEQRGQHLHLDVPDQTMVVDGDHARLMQVVTNLLQNAAKYTDRGGDIHVSLEHDEDLVKLQVGDNGIGLDAESQAQIFELFAQGERKLDRSQGGLGIGLTIVQRLVRMHGGEISVHSEGIGKGSRFTVTLPLAGTEAIEKEESAGTMAATGCRVLVVDDNHQVADGLAMLVGTLGHETQTCYNGEEALTMVRDWKPEVVFLDLGMPETDGYEVAGRLRMMEDRGRMLVVAVTGYGDQESRVRARRCGFDLHLLKPPSINMLESVMNRALRDRAAGTEV